MKHDIDIKITKNSEDKINKFSADDFLKKHVESSEPNPEKKDKEIFMPEISGWAIFDMYVIVGINLLSDIFAKNFKISTQTNVLAVLLVVLLIIKSLFKKEK